MRVGLICWYTKDTFSHYMRNDYQYNVSLYRKSAVESTLIGNGLLIISAEGNPSMTNPI